MKVVKLIVAFSIALLIVGCALPIIGDPKVGMNFDADTWAKGGSNAYVLVANTPDGALYRNNRSYSDFYNGGILVSNGQIVKVLSPSDLIKATAVIQEQQKIAQAKDAQKQKIAQAKADQAAAQKLNELRNRKYSSLPAKFRVQTQSDRGFNGVVVTSTDDEPFLLERVVVNNRVGNAQCDKNNLAQYMNTGDSKMTVFIGCGSSIVKINVYTNRGSRTFGD